jgi:hypothetical protein
MHKFTRILAVVICAGILVGCTNNTPSTTTGNTTTTTGAAGEFESVESETKPTQWPADVPTPAAAYGYKYARQGTAYSLSYKLKSAQTLSTMYAATVDAFKSGGWVAIPNTGIETDAAATESFLKGDQQLTIALSKEAANDYIEIGFIMVPKTQ